MPRSRRPLVGLLVASLLAVGACTGTPLGAQSPSTSPPPRSGGPVEPRVEPGGAENLPKTRAQVFLVVAGGQVIRVDLASRVTVTVSAPVSDEFSTYAATSSRLLAKEVGGSQGYVVTPSGRVGELPESLRGPGRFVLGGPGMVWSVAEEPEGKGRRASVTRFVGGTSSTEQVGSLPARFGLPGGDEAGGLLVSDKRGTYVRSGSRMTRLTDRELVAVGRSSVVVGRCAAGRGPCGVELRARAGRRPVVSRLSTSVASRLAEWWRGKRFGGGRLSPSGRFLWVESREREAWRGEVWDVGSGRRVAVPGVLAQVNPNDQEVWVADDHGRDRWLLVLTDQRLRIVDAVTGRVSTWSRPYRLLNVVQAGVPAG